MTDESGSKELHAQIVEWPLVFGGGVRICSHFANLEVSLGVFCTLGHCDCECFKHFKLSASKPHQVFASLSVGVVS
jgi:hypothetical protein